ncbi:glycosyltransferase [Beijerinckia sp. L45]|uniref:glycosyltransferase n=1 Tax=Beijerinckia sp. L45 TaxID=1641855 RepID=UPI00131AFC0E|nr:glycosyltransferase [Beijerinckia sp. L45]
MSLFDPISQFRSDPDLSVSVALATFNGAKFLAEQLESLRTQTLMPLELVIGDDRSDDETADIIANFAKTVPFPVRFTVNDERLHFGGNFLATASRCRGRYIAFCDQDDIWLPDKLRQSVDAMRAADAIICGHDAWLIDGERTRVGRLAHMRKGGVFTPLTLAPWGVFFGFSTTIRRELLEILADSKRGPDNIDPRRLLSHDRWVYFLGTTFGRTVYLKEPLVLYRQHGGNTFGAGKGGDSLSKLKRLLLADPQDLAFHLQMCQSRQELLAATARATGAWTARAEDGARYWERLTQIYERRLTLAQARSLSKRAAILIGLVIRGAYAAPVHGGLTLRAFAKDALATLGSTRSSSAIKTEPGSS